MRRVKNYPKEFKLEAVRLYIKNDRRLSETAEDLGIPASTLKGWKERYMNEIKSANQDKPTKKDYEEILKEKEKRIRDLEEEN